MIGQFYYNEYNVLLKAVATEPPVDLHI